MNITKKQWTIIGVVVALIAIWYFFLRKKPTESGYRTFGASQKVVRGTGIVAKDKPFCSRWVSSGEGLTEKCTWYNAKCEPTTVYDRPCTRQQANMGDSAASKNVVKD